MKFQTISREKWMIRFAAPNTEPKFALKEFSQLRKPDWQDLTQEIFSEIFRKSPVKRTKFSGLMRNIKFVEKTKSDLED